MQCAVVVECAEIEILAIRVAAVNEQYRSLGLVGWNPPSPNRDRLIRRVDIDVLVGEPTIGRRMCKLNGSPLVAVGLLLQARESRAGVSPRQQAWSRRCEDARGIDLRIDENSQEAILHFFPVLIAPNDKLLRIRVELVVRRVVVVREADDSRSLRQRDGLGEIVADLPI